MGAIPQGKSPTISYLHPHHRAMMRLQVAKGFSNSELAAAFGYTPAQITRIVNSPLYMVEMQRMEAQAEVAAIDASIELKMLQPRALEVVAEDLFDDSVDRKIRNATAFEILDRTGYGKKQEPQKHLHLHAHEHKEVQEMDPQDIYNEVIDLVLEEG